VDEYFQQPIVVGLYVWELFFMLFPLPISSPPQNPTGTVVSLFNKDLWLLSGEPGTNSASVNRAAVKREL